MKLKYQSYRFRESEFIMTRVQKVKGVTPRFVLTIVKAKYPIAKKYWAI
jgi:hypothetical protein